MKRSGVQCGGREGWGGVQRGKEEEEEEKKTGIKEPVEGGKPASSHSFGPQEDQYYSCQHLLAATECGLRIFSSISLIHLGI